MAFGALTQRFSRAGLGLYLLALGSLLLGPWGTDWPALFDLDRSALNAGEYWRFFSGPLVHANWQYLGFSIAGIFVLQQVLGRELHLIALAWGYAVIALAVGICMLAFSRFGSFDGLAAMLHGLFAYGAILAMRRDALLGWGILLLVGGKVIWEQLQDDGGLAGQLLNLPVANDAHLYGFAAGVVLGAVMVASVAGRSD